MYDPCLGRWTTQDPLAEKYPGISPYAYCANNPLVYFDPDGKFPEILWDISNVAVDVGSLIDNIKNGNVKGAIIDGGGLLIDVAAAIFPLVPGGAGMAIKAARAGDKAVDAGKTVEHIKAFSKYDSVRDPRNSGIGKNFTRRQKREALESNKKANGGVLRSDGDGRLLNNPKKMSKGENADMNQAEIDHIIPKSKGGDNTNGNLQVLSKEENLKKGNRLIPRQ